MLLETRAAVCHQWSCVLCVGAVRFLALLGTSIEPTQMGHAGCTECPRGWSLSQEKRGWHALFSQTFLLSTALQMLSKQENAVARNMPLL